MPESQDAFVATARKYRPQSFAEILAQPGVTVTLKNALATGRVHHAYLFSGPRGTGKTTTARVLAKALNCTNATAGDPCGTCDACVNFQSGKSLDVIEVDGASNRGVDDIRSLRERVAYASVGGGYKVYIVDEVHMLTNEAFNALLKTLEEPPKKVAFIFATTEPGKVPATILSRCQRFDFRRIAPEAIAKAIRKVVTEDSLDIDDGAVDLLARRAQGSLRDAFSLMDQTVAFAEGTITRLVVEEALGVISEESLFTMTALWSERKTTEAFSLLNDLWEAGVDPGEWAQAFGDHLRDLLAAHVGGVASPGSRFEEAAKGFELGDLLRAQIMLSELKIRLRHLNDPRPDVELYILRLFTLADTVTLSQALSGNVQVASRPSRAPAPKSTVQPENPAPLHDPPDDPTLELKVTARRREPEPEGEPQASTATEDESLPVEPWERFLAVLRKKAPWAASELRQGKLESHADGLAKFFVPESNPFNRDRFSSKGIRTAVVDAFKSVYGEKPRVEFRFGDSVKRAGDAQSLLGDNPELAELIKATDGEIVARRPRRREE
jgi:DNA polymerase-3 subunit gamma/tau